MRDSAAQVLSAAPASILPSRRFRFDVGVQPVSLEAFTVQGRGAGVTASSSRMLGSAMFTDESSSTCGDRAGAITGGGTI
ncbi:hypothetical protein [Streptomyces sp. NPDC001070]